MKTDQTLSPEEKGAEKLEASVGRMPRLVGHWVAGPPSRKGEYLCAITGQRGQRYMRVLEVKSGYILHPTPDGDDHFRGDIIAHAKVKFPLPTTTDEMRDAKGEKRP